MHQYDELVFWRFVTATADLDKTNLTDNGKRIINCITFCSRVVKTTSQSTKHEMTHKCTDTVGTVW